jgi:hypothetical protein
MTGIYLMLPALLMVLFSFLVVRAGAIALMMTGMEREKAHFQALSAFTRAGFTTREAEMVVNNPKRRRIVTWLIIIGNAGFIAIIVAATSSLVTSSGYNLLISLGILIIGLYILYRLMKLGGWTRKWERFIENRLVKTNVVEESRTEDLLRFGEGYGLMNVIITPDSPYVGHSLSELNTPESEFLVVGIERGREWISHPRAYTKIDNGDRLVVYGDLRILKSIIQQSGY